MGVWLPKVKVTGKTFIKKSLVFISLFSFLFFVFSCEEDFTDIRTNIVGNNDFTTNDTTFNITLSTLDVESVRADGIELGGVLGQYLLGVYNNQNYEKIEASIITQLDIPFNLQFDDFPIGPDNDTITSTYTLDQAFIKLPYQATFLGNSGSGPIYRLDSIIGQTDEPFSINVYRLSSFLNSLDPTNPTLQNSFQSDHQYDLFPETLHVPNRQMEPSYQLIPRNQDTAQFVLRRDSENQVYKTDTVIVTGNANPYIAIPLKESFIQEVFIDQYENIEFSSQDVFNDYFRGLYIEATGEEGSLISLNFNVDAANPVDQSQNILNLRPSLEIFYTRSVNINGNIDKRDTIIPMIDSFEFNQVRNSQYKMTDGNSVASNQAKVQGTAGSYINAKILGDDNDMNGIPDQLDFLRSKNWLINDARITLYVDQNTVGSDTIATPFRMFVFKDGVDDMNQPNQSQVLDYITEPSAVDGFLRLDSDRKPDKYVLNITDYLSELVAGEIDYLPNLGIKILSPTDLPVISTDTIIRDYSWNPKAVMLLNHSLTNGNRRPELRISYTERIEDN